MPNQEQASAPAEQPQQVDPTNGSEYDHMFDPGTDPSEGSIDAARVDYAPASQHPVTTKTLQQMGIDAADRKIRAAAGIPPRVHDLR